MRTILALIGVLVLGVIGCASPAQPEANRPPIELSTDRTEYAAGDSLQLFLRNGTSAEVTYNLCSVGLQIFVENSWRMEGEVRLCDLIGYVLPPGNIAYRNDRLPQSLSAGTYRFVTAVSVEGEEQLTSLASAGFTVR